MAADHRRLTASEQALWRETYVAVIAAMAVWPDLSTSALARTAAGHADAAVKCLRERVLFRGRPQP